MKAEDQNKNKSMSKKIRKRKPKNPTRNRGFAVEEMFHLERAIFNELSELTDAIVI